MKKILVIGELNQTVSNINRSLLNRFETQLCMDSLERVRAVVKVFEPDMVLICLAGVGELDDRILDFFSEENQEMSVLLIGTMEECKFYQKYYEKLSFDFLVRPFPLQVLMQRCLETLKLPVEEIEEFREVPVKRIVRPDGKKHILAVDDSGILLRNVKGLLDDKYHVTVATSGMMALNMAKKDIPDLILLDYDMPGWDGRKTLEVIRNDDELKHVPVVFLTAIADKNNITAVLELKPSGYLLKPIDPQKLTDTIEQVIEKGTV